MYVMLVINSDVFGLVC